MKNFSKAFLILTSLILSISLLACDNSNKNNNFSTQTNKETATWGDVYNSLLESGQETNHDDFDKLAAKLSEIRENSGATYVYTIMPISDNKASVNGDINGDFMLTIDGSKEPEDWGIVYHNEIQFTEAWSGEVAAARSAWTDGDGSCWSAFAPIYNSEGDVVCLLGVDYPSKEVTDIFPEWNRYSDVWNGFTDEITSEVPVQVQDKIDEVKTIVEKYADELSTNNL